MPLRDIMGADVTRNIEEQLSAFLDGELPEAELQLLIRRLEKDEAYRATLARYSLVGSVLRDEAEFSFANGIRARVMARISADEPDYSAPESRPDAVDVQQPGTRRLGRRAGSLLAAAVVAFAVIGVYRFDDLESGLSEGPAVEEVASTVSAVARPKYRSARASVDADRMTSYMVSHGEFSRSLQGTMVDSRVFVQQVSYQE
jgi:sigma-E factor negative regulatory protein RseA